jgi:basic membrane protein A
LTVSISTRRVRALVAPSALALALAASAVPGFAQSPAPEPTGADVTQVAVAYDLSGRGDGGFNDIAYNGAKQAADELGAEVQEVTAKPDDTDVEREERLRLLAESGFNPIIGVGFTYAAPMAKVAAEFPETFFAIVDDATIAAPNIATLTSKEHEGSFLVGVAAALTSETGSIGFIGAVPVPLIQKFEAGYVAGAKAVNPDIQIQVTYLSQPPDFSGFGDPGRGKEAALGMFDAGADVVFAAAGGSGQGLYEAAAQVGKWAIGVDADYHTLVDDPLKGTILTSMLKNANVGTYEFVTSVANRTFVPGHRDYGVAEGGVGYATSGGFVDDIKDQIDAYAAQISSGEIVVPDVPAAQ